MKPSKDKAPSRKSARSEFGNSPARNQPGRSAARKAPQRLLTEAGDGWSAAAAHGEGLFTHGEPPREDRAG